LAGIGTPHHRLIYQVKLGIGDGPKLERPLNGHGLFNELDTEGKTEEWGQGNGDRTEGFKYLKLKKQVVGKHLWLRTDASYELVCTKERTVTHRLPATMQKVFIPLSPFPCLFFRQWLLRDGWG
jgi:hypothetical protein